MIEKIKISEKALKKFKVDVNYRIVGTNTIHWHDFYELEICLDGSATTVINQTEYPVSKGAVFLITPSDLHKYTADENITVLNLTFTPDAIEYSGLIEKLYPMSYIVGNADEDVLKRLTQYIYQIKSESESPGHFSKKYISFLLSCILIELFRIGEGNPSHIKDEKYASIQKAIYYIRTHFREPINLKDVSEFSGVSQSVLSKNFTKILGVGFKEYLTQLRLDYAKQLIVQTDFSITDIAYSCGFNSLSYFQNVFVNKYKMTPKNYRKVGNETNCK